MNQNIFYLLVDREDQVKIYWSRVSPVQRIWKLKTDQRVLAITSLHRNDIGKYECSAEYSQGITKVIFSFDRSQSGAIEGQIRSYSIEPLYSQSANPMLSESSWPNLQLYFVGSFNHIPLNSKVEILCTSTSSNCFFFYFIRKCLVLSFYV